MPTQTTFSTMLTNLRQKAGLSQIKLAHRVGVHSGIINRLENGKLKPYDLVFLMRLAKELRVDRPIAFLRAALLACNPPASEGDHRPMEACNYFCVWG